MPFGCKTGPAWAACVMMWLLPVPGWSLVGTHCRKLQQISGSTGQYLVFRIYLVLLYMLFVALSEGDDNTWYGFKFSCFNSYWFWQWFSKLIHQNSKTGTIWAVVVYVFFWSAALLIYWSNLKINKQKPHTKPHKQQQKTPPPNTQRTKQKNPQPNKL